MRHAAQYWWNGKMQSISEIAKLEGVPYQTALYYVDKGHRCTGDIEKPYSPHNGRKHGKTSDNPFTHDDFIADGSLIANRYYCRGIR